MLARSGLHAISVLAAARWRWPLLVVGAAAVGVAGLAALQRERAPQTTAVQRGQALAGRLGCFGCHGPDGIGGVPNPGAAEGEVPPLRAVATLPSYVQRESELLEWVRDGQPARMQWASVIADEHELGAPLLRMPAYGDHLTASELDDVVAWLRAVGGYEQPRNPAVAAGRALARSLGCFGCHGEDGRGALSNPGSFKGVIPPWDSGDYLHLVQSEGELRQWILDGEIERFREHPAASFFLRRQAVKMPAYRGRITAEQLEQLVTYVRWLRAPSDFLGWQERWVVDRQAPDKRDGRDAQDATASAVRRGRALYVSTGCAACHGGRAEGGRANGRDVVPSLDDLADKLELFEAEDIAAFLAAVGRRERLTDPATALPIAQWPRVQEQVHRTRELIGYGATVAGSDEATSPAMPMPAWAFRVHADHDVDIDSADLDNIIAYLVSLSRTAGVSP